MKGNSKKGGMHKYFNGSVSFWNAFSGILLLLLTTPNTTTTIRYSFSSIN